VRGEAGHSKLNKGDQTAAALQWPSAFVSCQTELAERTKAKQKQRQEGWVSAGVFFSK